MSQTEPASNSAAGTSPRILVDAYNLALRNGSGIKTYGITLLEAYRRLGFAVNVLTANPDVSGRSPLLDEVMLFDQQEFRKKTWLDMPGVRALRQALHVIRKPSAVEVTPRVTVANPGDFLSQKKGVLYQKIANVPDVFHAANRLFSLTGRPVKLKLPAAPDIWHRTTLLPIAVSGSKSITTIHDLIPLRVPFATLDDKKMFHKLVRWNVDHSDAIFAVSEHTKKDLMELYQVPENKIHVTYQTCRFRDDQQDPARKSKDDAVFLKAKRLTTEKYVLFLGNIEPKKNIKALIRAMAYIDPSYKLAIVGRKAWLWENQLKDLDSYLGRYRYEFLDYLPNAELSVLLRNATCLVFPSIYEGFGLPVLEAMNHGCPVVCSRVSSLPEVGGDAVAYVDPYRHEDIRNALESLINSPDKREAMRAKGHKQAQRFSAENYDRRLQAAYDAILSR